MLPRIVASASRWTLGCVMPEGDRPLIGWIDNKAAACEKRDRQHPFSKAVLGNIPRTDTKGTFLVVSVVWGS
jgi:hypothetical protein